MPSRHDPYNAFLDHSEQPVASAGNGPLAGLSLAVKDIFDIAEQRTGCGNPQKLAEARPAETTAPALQALFDAGARFAGRTQTEELAFSLTGQNAHYPFPINPAAPDRVTGGSSSGSVAAVAGGLADIATGSDTGGSIRAPASFCGLIGLRTTHGAISLEGAMPLAPSLDTFGWFAKDIGTYEKVGEVLLGAARGRLKAGNLRVLRLPVLDAFLLGDAEAQEYRRMEAAVSAIVGAPANVALTHEIDALYWCFRNIQAHEAWASHGAWIGAADRGLGPGVKERFAFGSTVSVETARTETARRQAFLEELTALLGDDGVFVMPTVPSAAPFKDASFDDIQTYREAALRLLCLSGLAGLPQITLPLGTVHGAPFGISLLGPAGSDMDLIRLGRTILEAEGKA
jgi:amidase